MARELGDKLGVRLARLVTAHHVAVRQAMAPLEARIRAAGTQQVIDRAGREVAGHYADIIGQLLAADGDMPDWLSEHLQRTASGTHQWQAIAGVAGLTGITGGLGTIMTNYLAPAVQVLVSASPQLQLDQNAAATAAARNFVSADYGAQLAAQAGFNRGQFDLLYNMALAYPDAGTAQQLLNRGLIDEPGFEALMAWQGYQAEMWPKLAAMAQALISPADAALAVLRGDITADQGTAIAAANGYTAADFDLLVGNTGEPPAMEEMLMLWRRGQISEETLDRAITQSRVRDEWVPVVKLLAVEPPSGADVINALVQGQIDQETAQARWAQSGGDPTWFATAFGSAANSPAPVQLAEMANRGIIPWDGTGPQATSWQQGFYEGRWKDKWAPAYRQLAVYMPPPREVATLVKEGGMTKDEAMAYWQKSGLTPELAAMYYQATGSDTTAALHALSQSQIVKLYSDKAISRDEALAMLEGIDWSPANAEYLLDLADMALAEKMLSSAISKVRGLYIAWKIDKNAAAAALATLEVPASQAQQLLAIWGLEQADNVRTLTPAEITDAWFYQLMPVEQAATMLQQAGYTPYDAWVLLNVKNKGPITGFAQPAQ